MARHSASLDRIVAEIVDCESRNGLVPRESLTRAAEITRSARALHGGRLTRARVERYFAAVVRRHLVRSCGGSTAAAHVVAESVVEDLRASGRDGRDIVAALERGWGDRLPVQVIDEWRNRLCA